MVNYKRVICEVAVLTVLTVVSGAPTDNVTEGYHDHRQNGVENVRAKIDGVLIAVAPADSFIDGILDYMDPTDDTSDLEAIAALLKPPPSVSSTAKPEANSKPDIEKPAETPLSDVSLQSETKQGKSSQNKEASTGKLGKIQRLKHRLANVLIPLLRKHVNTEA